MKLLFLFIFSLSPLAFSQPVRSCFLQSFSPKVVGALVDVIIHHGSRQRWTTRHTINGESGKKCEAFHLFRYTYFSFSVDFCTHFINYCHCYNSRPYITCECYSNIPKMWDLAIHRFTSKILSSFNLFSFLEIKIKLKARWINWINFRVEPILCN